jgi:hypothetical protein
MKILQENQESANFPDRPWAAQPTQAGFSDMLQQQT